MPGSPIKEVILHVGLQKTGTSSIQSTLYNENNNKLILKEGILYPRLNRNHGAILCSEFNSKPEKFWANRFPKILSKEEIKNKDKLNLEKLEATVNNSDASRLILSGEDISTLSGENIKKMKNYLMDIGLSQAKFKVMVYTRSSVTWAVSMLQQRMKFGGRYDGTLNRIKNQELPSLFQGRIGHFIDVFGKENVYVYPFEKARTHKAGIVGHFLQELNVNKKMIEKLKQTRTNESTSMLTGEFLTYVNDKIPLITNGKQNEKRHKNDHEPLLRVKGNKFDIPLKERKVIASIAKSDIEWLKEQYHIDYSNEDINEEKKYENLDLSFKGVETIYPILTKTLRDALVEFLEHIFLWEIPSCYKNQCQELIKRLKEQEEDLISIDHLEERFQSTLNIDGVDKALMYRELALFMEAYDQIGSAELLMRKAGLYRPKGQFIKKKHEEYKKKIQQECKGNNRCDSLNGNIQNKTLLGLSKKKQALFGVGIVGSAIGLFNLFNGTKSKDKQ